MRPKILVLTPRYPYPVIGGDRLRIYYICKELSKHADLTLLSLCEKKSELNSPLPNDGLFSSIERFYLPKWKSWIQSALAIASKNPLQIAYYKCTAFEKRINDLAKNHDSIFCHLIRTGDYAKNIKIKKFLEMTDAISLNYSRVKLRDKNLNLLSVLYKIEQSRIKKYESSIIEKFDCTFIVSDIDLNYIDPNHEYRSKLLVSSNGVDYEKIPYSFNHSSEEIVFIGNINTLQNMDMVLYMADKILPLVNLTKKNAKLKVIGRISNKNKNKLLKYNNLIITGEVEDVLDHVKNASVAVCPMRIGAGVQNKILEYMSIGLPTVVTPKGLEGFSAKHGSELLVANNAKDFSDCIVRIINDRNLAFSLSKAARTYIEKNHSWSAKLSPLIKNTISITNGLND